MLANRHITVCLLVGGTNLHLLVVKGWIMRKMGEGLVLMVSLIGVGLALLYLFLVWIPSFKTSL